MTASVTRACSWRCSQSAVVRHSARSDSGLAILAHSVAGIGLILLIVGHIYLAIWVRGSITGMVTGYVSRAWARQHHDRWYGEVKAKEGKKVEAKGSGS